MTENSLITAGKVVGVFGVKGWVKVKTFTSSPSALLNYGPWYLEGAAEECSQPRRVEVDASRVGDKGLLVHIHGVDDRDAALALLGSLIRVHKSALPGLGNDEYYWHELEGLRVITVGGVDLGRVGSLMETGANDVLVVRGDEKACDRRERLIPYLPGQFVRSVDLPRGQMVVDWDPEF